MRRRGGFLLRCLAVAGGMGWILLSAQGCGRGGDSSPTVARINSYYLSTEDFREEVKNAGIGYRPELEQMYAREQFLEEIIQKKLLLQEAVRLDLDKGKEFMRVIERFWEQALLKNLMRRKEEEFARQIKVTAAEVQDYYERMKREVRARAFLVRDEKSARTLAAGAGPLGARIAKLGAAILEKGESRWYRLTEEETESEVERAIFFDGARRRSIVRPAENFWMVVLVE
ncbi:MAG: hypothetical protein ACE5JJ_06880, partial [Nitrospinota bacterium]